jgi:hypothetical protein
MESRFKDTTRRTSTINEDPTDGNNDQRHYNTKNNSFDRCRFAKTCNGGDGILFPTLFCSSEEDTTSKLSFDASSNTKKTDDYWLFIHKLYHSISRILLIIGLSLVLLLLFRLLNSTTDEFFSPGLEMFSLHLGLPPRFAGVVSVFISQCIAFVASIVFSHPYCCMSCVIISNNSE